MEAKRNVSSLEDIAIANNAGYKAYWKAHEGDVYIITRISGAFENNGVARSDQRPAGSRVVGSDTWDAIVDEIVYIWRQHTHVVG